MYQRNKLVKINEFFNASQEKCCKILDFLQLKFAHEIQQYFSLILDTYREKFGIKFYSSNTTSFFDKTIMKIDF